MKNFKITKKIVDKLNKTIDAGLVAGLGEPIPGKMCVEAAVCYALGLPHSDDPKCVNYALRNFKITLNDSSGWNTDKSRAKGLKKLAVAQLGTNIWKKEDEELFVEEIIIFLMKEVKKYAKKENSDWVDWADSWLSGKLDSNSDITQRLAGKYYNTSNYHFGSLCYAVMNFDAENYTGSVNYTEHVINSLVENNNYDEKVLKNICDKTVKILIKMETPGSKWL